MFKNILENTTANLEIITLSHIVDCYDTYLVDIWGVMHNGEDFFTKSIQAINSLLVLGKKVVFLSNMPRPGKIVFDTMKQNGVHDGYHVVTSGDLTRNILQHSYENKKIYHLGKTVNADILSGLNVKTVDDIAQADCVLLTIFTHDSETEADTLEICQKIVNYGLPVLCANPDKEAFKGKLILKTAGYFAKHIEALNGDVQYIGKPFMNIYEYAFSMHQINTQNNRVLMIGDTIQTDVLGALNANIDSVLVLSGVTKGDLDQNNISLFDYCDRFQLPYPNFVMKQLAL